MPLQSNDGGYVRVDAGGFQILLNFRGTEASFYHISITDVLDGDIPEDLFSDRLVLIGSTASSINDMFVTPYSNNQGQYLPGVFVHANLASQILSSALDGRASIRVVSEPYEWLWVFTWTLAGSAVCLVWLNRNVLSQQTFSIVESTVVCLILPGVVLFGSGYVLFLWGWWLPVITPLSSLIVATVIINSYCSQNQKQLAFIDDLTQIPNRRFFEQFLAQHWYQSQKKQQDLCLILCDVDFFKKYNDTYGHQAGDVCLKQVAHTLAQSVRSCDLAARYGGEEFVVVLPYATPDVAMTVANRIGDRLKSLQIPHSSSGASPYVSLSCGVASSSKDLITSPKDLIAHADRALYQAKEQGRNCSVLAD
jgi:diguanylate cyclase (GGDEF)-like protein